MVQVTWPRWPPCPYMIKTFKNLLLQNQKSYDLETWHVALGTQALQSLYKWWPWVDLDLFYGKVKLGHLYVWMGKTVIKSFNGGKLAAKDYIDWIILLMKKIWPQGVVWPCPGAIYLYMTTIFKQKRPRGRAVSAPVRITGSRVRIPLEARFFPNLNGASLHRAFHVHPSIVSKWLKYCWRDVKPVHPSIFKHLLHWNRLANQSQILCRASLGTGNEGLYKWSRSHDQDGRHAHIW